jgi:hypothetical protein
LPNVFGTVAVDKFRDSFSKQSDSHKQQLMVPEAGWLLGLLLGLVSSWGLRTCEFLGAMQMMISSDQIWRMGKIKMMISRDQILHWGKTAMMISRDQILRLCEIKMMISRDQILRLGK